MKRLISIITVLCAIIAGAPFSGKVMAADMSDYTALPPFIATSIQPNVMIVLDNSGSMNEDAYATTYDPTQFANGQYYGLFDATKYYQYTASNRWEPILKTVSPDTYYNTTNDAIPASGPAGVSSTTRPIASGNLLNWATMSRLSVAKKLLIGGKASPRSPAGPVTVKTYAETTWGFSKTYVNSSNPNLISNFSGNFNYTMSASAALSITPATGSSITNTYPGYTDSVFNETVEAGAGSWVSTGLWHVENGSGNCSNAYEGTSSWYYGNANDPDKCTYRTKSGGVDTINFGTLTSPSITLPAGSPRLSFMSYYHTETSSTLFDRRYVQISTDGGATFADLQQLSSDQMDAWGLKTINLSSYAGMSIKLRFFFHTVDAISNSFWGWSIDNIRIDNSTSCYNVAKPAAWTIFPASNTACQAVDDTNTATPYHDSDITYIQNASTQDPIILDYNDLDPQIGTITQVQVIAVAKQAGTSTSATRRISRVLRIGGVNYCGPYASSTCNYSALTTSYASANTTWTTNPATGAAWTWSDLKKDGVGSIQGFGVQATTYMPTSTNYIRASKIYLLVTVTLPTGGPYSVIIDQGMTKAEGIIDHLSSDARFGLGYYDGASNGGKVQEYVGFGAATNMITSISGKTATTATPLGETLYEMTRYFRQDPPYYSNSPADYATSLNNDPYYYRYTTLSASTLPDQYVPCAKSFILFLTDGESTADTSLPASIKGYSWGKGKNPDGSLTGSAVGNSRLAGTNNGQLYSGSGTDYMIDVAYWGRSNDGRPGTCTSKPTSWNQCIPGTQSVITYPVFLFGQGSTLLKDVAIYGGFDDLNGDGMPGPALNEYLRDSNGDGSITAADDPITYFEGSDGFALETSITNAISDIMKRSSSGTSVAILATSSGGEGSLYQAYFYPEKNVGTDKRTWLGYCRGIFLDSYGNMRENTTDSDSSKKALVFKDDKILRMRLDTTLNKVMIDRYLDANEDMLQDSVTTTDIVGLDDPVALWEGGRSLALKSKAARNMYVWVDNDNDAAVDNKDFGSPTGEAMLFTTANASALMPYLNASTAAEATNIISFIRGNYVSGYRNRCIPISGQGNGDGCSGTDERTWALGDIIYASPTVVSGTNEQYDLVYGSSATSFSAFRKAYTGRRQMVYVASNDGVLHAYNGGVYKAGDDSTTGAAKEHGWFIANPATGNGWGSAGFGDELWSMVLYDNLPHLKWLTQTDYSHVYYNDLKPKPTDVRIFCDGNAALNPPASCINGQNTSHPGGWGTILIVGMRYGGGAMSLTSDFGSGVQTRTFRSAYYAFDVTDPEKKPALLWRFTDAGLGLTSSYPGIAHILEKDGSGLITGEKWFMVVGSGPDNNVPPGTRGYDGTSTQQGKVFIVNILDGSLARTFGAPTIDGNAFMGDPTVVDGDLDYTADVIYIGSSISATAGKVYRINTNRDPDPANWKISTLINQGKPLLAGPTVTTDKARNLWVFFGTGRFLNNNDKLDSNPQSFYGIKDGCWKENSTANPCASTYTLSQLFDSSNIVACDSSAGGAIWSDTGSATGDCGSGTKSYNNFDGLLTAAKAKQGWYINFDNPSTPTERVLSKAVILGGVVIFTSFIPDSDLCALGGKSGLWAVDYETGAAASYLSKAPLGTKGSGASKTVMRKEEIGEGMPTGIGVLAGEEMVGFVQTQTGELIRIELEVPKPASGAAGWREKSSGGNVTIEEIYKHVIK